MVAEAKARNDAIAAKEQAREAAKKAEEKRAQEQALKAQEAAAKSAMEANRRHLGSVMKFIPEKKFGFILDVSDVAICDSPKPTSALISAPHLGCAGNYHAKAFLPHRQPHA